MVGLFGIGWTIWKRDDFGHHESPVSEGLFYDGYEARFSRSSQVRPQRRLLMRLALPS